MPRSEASEFPLLQRCGTQRSAEYRWRTRLGDENPAIRLASEQDGEGVYQRASFIKGGPRRGGEKKRVEGEEEDTETEEGGGVRIRCGESRETAWSLSNKGWMRKAADGRLSRERC